MYIETEDDLRRKYEDTFVQYKKDLIVVSNFYYHHDKKVMYIVYTDQNGTETECVYDDGVVPLLFDTHFFNREIKGSNIPGTLYVRLAKKQYKRSLSIENSKLMCPIIDLYAASGRGCSLWRSNWNFMDVKSMLNPVYPNYFDAIKDLPKYQVLAISPKFAVCLSNLSQQRYLLCSSFGFIGECDLNVVTIKHEAALQEVLDYVAHATLPLRVELDA